MVNSGWPAAVSRPDAASTKPDGPQTKMSGFHSGANAAVRAEARKELPTLRKHLATARAALKKVSS